MSALLMKVYYSVLFICIINFKTFQLQMTMEILVVLTVPPDMVVWEMDITVAMRIVAMETIMEEAIMVAPMVILMAALMAAMAVPMVIGTMMVCSCFK